LPKEIGHVHLGPVFKACVCPERESNSVELIITKLSFFIAEQDFFETCMIGMNENLPIHLGEVIEDVFKETPFEDLCGQIRLL